MLVNICNQDLCYRQQGTDTFDYLLKGKQAHLLWSDMSRFVSKFLFVHLINEAKVVKEAVINNQEYGERGDGTQGK